MKKPPTDKNTMRFVNHSRNLAFLVKSSKQILQLGSTIGPNVVRFVSSLSKKTNALSISLVIFKISNWFTHSTKRSYSWEANSQEISFDLWTPYFHYRFQNVHLWDRKILPASFSSIYMSVSVLSSRFGLGLPSCLFHSGFRTKTLNTLLSFSCALHALLISSSLMWRT
jgi:hypothetical protein